MMERIVKYWTISTFIFAEKLVFELNNKTAIETCEETSLHTNIVLETGKYEANLSNCQKMMVLVNNMK